MKCDIRFDYISQHNGQYWFKCETCGATDWVGRYSTLTSMKECLKDAAEALTVAQKKLVERAYNNGYNHAKQEMLDAVTGPKSQSVESMLKA